LRILFFLIGIVILFSGGQGTAGERAAWSPDTDVCLDCHRELHPGIVSDWLNSRHSYTKPSEALTGPMSGRRISARSVPEELLENTVGCAECHTLRPEAHRDTFDHNGYDVHVVVSPADCATCHPVEREEYEHNIMSRAHGNLVDNPVYSDLAAMINGVPEIDADASRVNMMPSDPATDAVSCLFCHGTRLEATETVSRDTEYGEMDFPVISGWPNQGVGRVNLDGTLGACAACHTRHRFSIEMARKPHTCSQCHKGPDAPGYKVYDVSKHGNIYSSAGKEWSFDPVPWVPGRDFTAPTCAACHVSLIEAEDGLVVAERTHRMNDRLAWRLFGVYAHPHPDSADTTGLRNREGLPLPAELDGRPAPSGLITGEEQAARREAMKRVCLSCHAGNLVDAHFHRLDRTIETTNRSTLAATRIVSRAWQEGLAEGPGEGGSPFDESIEKAWAQHWLFYANSTRLACAMMGGDYGVFDNGRWQMARNIRDMLERLENARRLRKTEKE
jgi:hydroxylamine dehydrogenase